MKIPVGISSCLLGEKVRYDGGHKLDSYIKNSLGKYFEFRAFCPEVAIGLGVPRNPIRLIRKTNSSAIHCVAIDDPARDYTTALRHCANEQLNWQRAVCGYIVKKGSPSCGMQRVKVYGKGRPAEIGTSIFTAALLDNIPDLPVEDESRLDDASLRENFIKRVYVYWRWQKLCSESLTVTGLMDFHARHKLIIMSHDQKTCRKLGNLVSSVNNSNLACLAETYIHELMSALKKIASIRNHVNVLQHVQSYLKHYINSDEKQELQRSIEQYRLGLLPLSAAITLLKHHFQRSPSEYIASSWYMSPYPAELGFDELN